MKRRVGVVIQREFWTTVRRPSYVISTLGMPVFMLLIVAVASIPGLMMAKKQAQMQSLGVVDRSGFLGLTHDLTFSLPPPPAMEQMTKNLGGIQRASAIEEAFADATKVELKPYATLEAGQTALKNKEVASLVEFPEDYLRTGNARSYEREGFPGSGGMKQDLLRRFVVERLLAGKLDPTLLERVRRPLAISESFTLNKAGVFEPTDIAKVIVSFAVPLVFTVLFFISVMMSSGFLLQGVSEEKENRVIEVILSSIDSDSLLLGKLIGLGGAGLLQIAVWSGLVAVAQLILKTMLAASGVSTELHLRASSIAWSFVFYLLGYLLFGVLLTGTGSLGQNLKESQQYGMMWTLGSILPMMSLMFLLSEPNGTYARILSFIPLTAPVTMFLRLNSIDPPAWWETLLAAGILAFAVWGALKLMSNIFRVGLLLYGKRPTIPEILKLLRRRAA